MLKKLKKIVKSNSKEQETTLNRINDYVFELYNKPQTYKSQPSFSPSSLGAKCLRKIYYGYWKVEKDFPINDRAAKIFATGDAFEDLLMEWIKGIGEHIPYRNKTNGKIPKNRFSGKTDPQFPITSKKWEIKRGYIDNVGIIDGETWIYEIKSSNEKKFKLLKTAEEAHQFQAGIYFHAFNDMLLAGEFSHIPELKDTKPAVGIKYFYINKNTSEIKEFLVPKTIIDKHINTIDKRVADMQLYTRDKILPPQTEDYCFFCSFKLKCKKDWNKI